MDKNINNLDIINNNIDIQIRKIKNIKDFILQNNIKLQKNKREINTLKKDLNLKLRKCEDIKKLNEKYKKDFDDKSSEFDNLNNNMNKKISELMDEISNTNDNINKKQLENENLKNEIKKLTTQINQPMLSKLIYGTPTKDVP